MADVTGTNPNDQAIRVIVGELDDAASTLATTGANMLGALHAADTHATYGSVDAALRHNPAPDVAAQWDHAWSTAYYGTRNALNGLSNLAVRLHEAAHAYRIAESSATNNVRRPHGVNAE